MTLFLVLGFVGLGLVALSLVVGDHLEAAFGGAFNALEGDVFSTAVLGGFISAFGFGAAAADGAGLPTPRCCYRRRQRLRRRLVRVVADPADQGRPERRHRLDRGHRGPGGAVLTDIPGGESYGVVRVSVGGHVMQCNASSLLAIEPGSEVSITGVLSPTAVTVAPVWNPQS